MEISTYIHPPFPDDDDLYPQPINIESFNSRLPYSVSLIENTAPLPFEYPLQFTTFIYTNFTVLEVDI